MTVDDNVLWISDDRMNSQKIKDGQRRDPVISCFLRMKEEEDKPGWKDISAPGSEFKSYWTQLESMVMNQEGLCRKLTCPVSFSRMQVWLM